MLHQVDRTSTRFQFQYFRPTARCHCQSRRSGRISCSPTSTSLLRHRAARRIGAEGAAAYDASLEINAGYGQAEIEPVGGVRLSAAFATRMRSRRSSRSAPPGADPAQQRLLSAAATLTWNIRDDLQLRLHGSRTIARPSSASSRRKSTRISNPTANSPATRSW
jgi:hypothetical protein